MDHTGSNGQASLKASNSPVRRQGSMRKVLTAPDGSESLIGVSAKILERTEPKSLPAVYYYNFFKEYNLMVEYNLLRRHLQPGLFVIPSATSKFMWFGVIFVQSGLYEGGVFRFSIHISQGFPDSKCPKVMFECAMFHPNVDEDTMELDVNQRFPEWSKETNHIWQVVHYLYDVFHCINFTQQPVNRRAAQMYVSEKEEFVRCVGECVEMSRSSVMEGHLNRDPHYPVFTNYNERIHLNSRQSLLTPQREDEGAIGTRKGYSWIESGTVRAFSKPYNLI